MFGTFNPPQVSTGTNNPPSFQLPAN
jgi:hypothetical protein